MKNMRMSATDWQGIWQILSFIGALFVLISSIGVWHSRQSADKEKEAKLTQQFEEQKEHLIFAAALDNQIRDVRVFIRFDREMMWDEVFETGIPIEIVGTTGDNNIESTSVSVTKPNAQFGKSNAHFQVTYHSTMAGSLAPKVATWPVADKISELEIPIIWSGISHETFRTIRDLHGARFTPYFSSRLVNHIASIEFVVNGWVIITCNPETVFWREEEVQWDGGELKFRLLKPWSSDFKQDQIPYGMWSMNIDRLEPKKKRK